jgi:hypothetical protein
VLTRVSWPRQIQQLCEPVCSQKGEDGDLWLANLLADDWAKLPQENDLAKIEQRRADPDGPRVRDLLRQIDAIIAYGNMRESCGVSQSQTRPDASDTEIVASWMALLVEMTKEETSDLEELRHQAQMFEIRQQLNAQVRMRTISVVALRPIEAEREPRRTVLMDSSEIASNLITNDQAIISKSLRADVITSDASVIETTSKAYRFVLRK